MDDRIPFEGASRDLPEGASRGHPINTGDPLELTLQLRLPEGATPLSRVGTSVVAGSLGSAASDEDMHAVEEFCSSEGLQVTDRGLSRRRLVVSGLVRDFQRAFGVELFEYAHDGASFRGREGGLLISGRIAPLLAGVFGLDDRPAASVRTRVTNPIDDLPPWAEAPTATLTGPSWPSQIAQVYEFPEATGKGERIAILEFGGGYRNQDLTDYFQKAGISPEPETTWVSVDGGVNAPTGGEQDAEVYLDVEVAGSVAPEAAIVVYFAPNTERGFVDAVSAAVHSSPTPSVLCISWGFPESTWTRQAIDAMEALFDDAAMLGITVLASAGDHGSSDSVDDGLAHARFPATSPSVTACGGTQLSSAIPPFTERVWNSGDGWATGGGVSDIFGVPAWQAELVQPKSVNPTGENGRGIPDLAALADHTTGYIVGGFGQYTPIGGTSAVVPLYGGLVARLNQRLGRRVGALSPLLYRLAGTSETADVFREITEGDNRVPPTRALGPQAPWYEAGDKWDACTGLGSVHGERLLAALPKVLDRSLV